MAKKSLIKTEELEKVLNRVEATLARVEVREVSDERNN